MSASRLIKSIAQIRVRRGMKRGNGWGSKLKITSPVVFIADVLLILIATLFTHLALAFDMPDVLDDPLWTKPPILLIGPALPDGAPIECPGPVDLTQCSIPQISPLRLQ